MSYAKMIEKWKKVGWRYVIPHKSQEACLISNHASMMYTDGKFTEVDVYTKQQYWPAWRSEDVPDWKSLIEK
jgi:hypothetical protein